MEAICSICLSKLLDTESSDLETIACGHVFHLACLDEWSVLNPTCPSCNKKYYTQAAMQMRRIFISSQPLYNQEELSDVLKKELTQQYQQHATQLADLHQSILQAIHSEAIQQRVGFSILGKLLLLFAFFIVFEMSGHYFVSGCVFFWFIIHKTIEAQREEISRQRGIPTTANHEYDTYYSLLLE